MPHPFEDAAFWQQDIELHVPLYVAPAMHGHLGLALRAGQEDRPGQEQRGREAVVAGGVTPTPGHG
jgi:hypothetical protein